MLSFFFVEAIVYFGAIIVKCFPFHVGGKFLSYDSRFSKSELFQMESQSKSHKTMCVEWGGLFWLIKIEILKKTKEYCMSASKFPKVTRSSTLLSVDMSC